MNEYSTGPFDELFRASLEQLGWAYAAYSTETSKLSKLKPNKCITKLKEIFPDAGKLYGRLSEWAHIDTSVISDYERFHAEGIPVVRRSDHNSQQSGIHLMCLSVIYLKTLQNLFSVYDSGKFNENIERLHAMYEEYLNLGVRSEGHNKSKIKDAQ